MSAFMRGVEAGQTVYYQAQDLANAAAQAAGMTSTATLMQDVDLEYLLPVRNMLQFFRILQMLYGRVYVSPNFGGPL